MASTAGLAGLPLKRQQLPVGLHGMSIALRRLSELFEVLSESTGGGELPLGELYNGVNLLLARHMTGASAQSRP
jgi:hypothetical protein